MGSMLCGDFGFLCSVEFTCPTSAVISNHVLSVSDVGVDSHSNPSFASVHLRHSKTDIFGMGATVHLGLVDGPVCPAKALLTYLALQGPAPGPLFLFQNGSPLSRLDLVKAVQSALESQGMDVARFNSHSFWIGAATTAAACGIQDSLIQALGHWKSLAFTMYIQTPKDSLIVVSSVLLSSTQH